MVDLHRLKSIIETEFIERDLIVVSSREPYVHKKAAGGIKVDRPAGGLTSAMDDVLRAIGGTWVAWGSGSADKDVVTDDRVAVPPDKPSYTLRRVWLTANQVNNYYHGYSNHVLWPLSHLVLDKVYFRKRYWRDYVRVNDIFARAVLDEAGPESIVWLHDYHLCMVPKRLKEAKPDLTVVHFWHIPWPDWGVFRVCPQAREILESMLAGDLIGFQIPLFVKNFMDCVATCFEGDPDVEVDYRNSTVTRRGHTTTLKAFPISIDYDRFEQQAASERTVETIKKIRDRFKIGGYTGIGVDRLEYTKALVKRLQAIELFFEKYSRFRGKFTFVQVAVPTRTKEPYLSYRRAVEAMVERINARYSTRTWNPIVYLDKKVDFKDLAVYYRIADLAVISSVYDGMNLVAKEYAACQIDEKGTLILSEFAGAAEELEGSILVNPYDIDSFADTIKDALVMPAKDKAARMSVLRRQVREHDIYRWIADILEEMVVVATNRYRKHRYLLEKMDRFARRAPLEELFLFLDYDGTLTPIVDTPDMAIISDEVRSLVKRIATVVPVAVVSGRELEDLKGKVGLDGIIYAGNHGAEIWEGESISVERTKPDEGGLMKEFLDRLRTELAPIEGAFVEDKTVTASIHFRGVRTRDLADFFDRFSRVAEGYEDSFRITSGKKVFEIRPLDAWNKGDAVTWIAEQRGEGRIPVYIGDDTTDEDAYRALKNKGISVSIGINPVADYYLKSQQEVAVLLKELADSLGV